MNFNKTTIVYFNDTVTNEECMEVIKKSMIPFDGERHTICKDELGNIKFNEINVSKYRGHLKSIRIRPHKTNEETDSFPDGSWNKFECINCKKNMGFTWVIDTWGEMIFGMCNDCHKLDFHWVGK